MPRKNLEQPPDPFPDPSNPPPGAAASRPPPLPGFLLPSNLDGALRTLDDIALARLLDAVQRETQRRSPQPEERAASNAKPSPSVKQKQVQPTIAVARAAMIRAAFKAGLKPAAIARQFGLSQSVVRTVLADRPGTSR